MKSFLRSPVVFLSFWAVFFIGGCYSSSSNSSSSPISVSLSPSAPQSVDQGQTINITASVMGSSGYSSGNGMTWSLSGAGSLANQTATSVTYDAPASVSMPEAATVTATSVVDTTKNATLSILVNVGNASCSTGNESKLNGSYAILMQGFNSNGYVAVSGQFTADGTGKITGGQEDVTTTNSTTGATPVQVNPAGSSYSLGTNDRGCLTLATSAGSTVFRFSVGSSNGTVFTKGRLIEFDDKTGAGQHGAGIIRLQDPTAFSTSKFTGNYAFGGSGVNSSSQRFAIAGVADLSSGTVTGGTADADDGGTVFSNQNIVSGSYAINSATGRGTLSFIVGASTIDFAFYVVSSNEAIVMTTDPLSLTNSIAAGEAKLQSGSFSSSSLSGTIVLHDTGLSPSGPLVVLGLLSANGVNSISGPTLNNVAGMSGTSTLSETYAVAPNGRVVLTGGSTPPVFYLYGANQGFEVGTGPDSSFGFLENQAAGPFSDTSLSGLYFIGTEDPAASPVGMNSGEITANGSGASPAFTGLIDESNLLGLSPGVPFTASYSIGSNGVGNITVSGAPTTDTVIMISPTKLVFFENGNRNPAIFVVEQ